jgi:hypothetical protein
MASSSDAVEEDACVDVDVDDDSRTWNLGS